MPPSAPPRASYGTAQIPITRRAGSSSRRRPAELRHPPGEAWAVGRGGSVPPVPGRKKLERAGAERHFTPKFPPALNGLELLNRTRIQQEDQEGKSREEQNSCRCDSPDVETMLPEVWQPL
ncbi:uncharacterized protein LOC143269579 [Peromyscus maniculatus bairdii]|uniref:uncharacterized protein LOC143269579 n=1 Tax=Peromyscus maniculatus bairdii TaxID=230844 RepID=UPI003FD5F372